MKDIGLDESDLGRAHMLQHWAYVDRSLFSSHTPDPQLTQSVISGLDRHAVLRCSLSINGNMHEVTFWIMAHILYNPTLLETIREERAPGIVENAPDIP